LVLGGAAGASAGGLGLGGGGAGGCCRLLGGKGLRADSRDLGLGCAVVLLVTVKAVTVNMPAGALDESLLMAPETAAFAEARRARSEVAGSRGRLVASLMEGRRPAMGGSGAAWIVALETCIRDAQRLGMALRRGREANCLSQTRAARKAARGWLAAWPPGPGKPSSIREAMI